MKRLKGDLFENVTLSALKKAVSLLRKDIQNSKWNWGRNPVLFCEGMYSLALDSSLVDELPDYQKLTKGRHRL